MPGLFVKIGNKVFARPVTGRSYKDDLLVGGGGALKAPAGTQTAQQLNSTLPSAAALSNTVPGYSALGGRWISPTLVGVAAATDWLLFSHQVPAGYRLIVNSVSFSTMVTVAFGTGPALFDWFLSMGDAASLADASQRRLPLGMQGIPSAAAIGVAANDLARVFDSPLVVPSAKFFGIGMATPAVPATSGTVRGTVTVNGYYEPEA